MNITCSKTILKIFTHLCIYLQGCFMIFYCLIILITKFLFTRGGCNVSMIIYI